jgi:HTH-type transcriptional regulator/antitoxin HigA
MNTEFAKHLDYLAMLAQIDSMFDDYDSNKQQIDRLALLIEQYESTSSYFAEFNKRVADITASQALLSVLLEQHNLTIEDFAESIGSSEQVVGVLEGKQSLTSQQLLALSKQFGISFEATLSI